MSVASQIEDLAHEISGLAGDLTRNEEKGIASTPFEIARMLAGVDGETWVLLSFDDRLRYERYGRAIIAHFDPRPVQVVAA